MEHLKNTKKVSNDCYSILQVSYVYACTCMIWVTANITNKSMNVNTLYIFYNTMELIYMFFFYFFLGGKPFVFRLTLFIHKLTIM